jgi:hypothetical protein
MALHCRKCPDRLRATGPAPVAIAGGGYLTPVVHESTGLELGADGHVAAPIDLAEAS